VAVGGKVIATMTMTDDDDVPIRWTDLMDMHRQASTTTSLGLTGMSSYFFLFRV
jgi:hypothetical protein